VHSLKTLSKINDKNRIPLNCSIDDILGGGIEKGIITQFYGPPGIGKTNIALTLAVNCSKDDRKVIFVDTEGGLSIERVKQISGSEFQKVAGNIIIFEPTTFREQDEVLKRIENMLESEGEVELLILDSAVALYRLREGDLSQINQELGRQMGLLLRIARKHDIAVIITNHVYSSFEGEGIEPVGGTILKYRSKIMVELAKGNLGGERYAILKRHRSRPEGLRTSFRIVNKGLQ
jgi:DNA repair protein RadB